MQHGQPAVPVNGEYHRMEDHDFTKRFKNKTRLNILGKVAWLERPLNKSRPKVALQLTEAGDDAVTIDWRPAVPEWASGRLQLVLAEGVLGILEDEQKFWKLHQEYSQEEVDKLLEDDRDRSRSGSPVLALQDTENPALARGRSRSPSRARRDRPANWLGPELYGLADELQGLRVPAEVICICCGLRPWK